METVAVPMPTPLGTVIHDVFGNSRRSTEPVKPIVLVLNFLASI